MYGYQTIFEEWIKQANVEVIGLQGGPCVIDLDSDVAPICDEMWPFVSKIIDEAVRTMNPLLNLAGAEEKNMSPICKGFYLLK